MNTRNGFTLLELILAVFMFSFISLGIVWLSTIYFKTYSFSFEENQSIGIAQYGITMMVKEIREARNGDDGAWPLVICNDNDITFYSDVTNDGRSDKIRYFLDGTILKKGIIQPTTVPVTYPTGNEVITTIASSVDTSTGPIFTYYNGNWPVDITNNPLIAASRQKNSRFIKIHIRINITNNYGSKPLDLTSGVQIRSLKDNL
jgi:prepilin-type N-terminal cleavage/methylation domain-containing protein